MNKTGSENTREKNPILENIGRLMSPKYWPQQVHICEQKKLNRAIHQARCNPDYRQLHPAECRGNPEGKTLTECHPEAKIRILKELANKIKSVNRPLTKMPPRYNRS